MTEKTKKWEAIFICVAVVVAYIMMYVITLMYENAISSEIYADIIIRKNIEALAIAGIVILIPFERLSYIFNQDIVRVFLFSKPKDSNKRLFIESAVVYGMIVFWCTLFKSDYYVSISKRTDLIQIVMTFAMIWFMVNSFKLIKSNTWLMVVDILAMFVNGAAIYWITNSSFKAGLTIISMYVAWNVCNSMSDRKNKLISLVASTISTAALFDLAIEFTGKQRALAVWFNPTLEINLPYSMEQRILGYNSLNLPECLAVSRQYNHPFRATYHYFGLVALIIMIMAFVIITIAYIRSHKLLSKGRFNVLTCIYSMFAVLYIYTFLADLGYVPTAFNVALLSVNMYAVAIGVVIRLFIVRKVPESTIDFFSYNDELDEFYDDDEDYDYNLSLTVMKEKRIQRKQADIMIQYLASQAHELDIIYENLYKIYDKIGEEMIKDCDDGYKEAMEKLKGITPTPQNIKELYEEIHKLYDWDEKDEQ